MARTFEYAFSVSGLTATDYAERLSQGIDGDSRREVSDDQVYRFASGRTVLPAWLFRRVARLAGMSMDQLYALANNLPLPAELEAVEELEDIKRTLRRIESAVSDARHPPP